MIYQDSCYRTFETTDKMNWNEAQSICVVWGGDLASIPTQRVNNFMQTITYNTNSEYWIGLYEDINDNFIWNDGTMSNYRNFGTSGLSDLNIASCVMMGSDGEWKNVNCDNEMEGFICNRNLTYNTGNILNNEIHNTYGNPNLDVVYLSNGQTNKQTNDN